jgi:hypothetical protein
MRLKAGTVALFTSVAAASCLIALEPAAAGFFNFTPNPPAPTPIPEIDGPAGIAAIALLVGIVAILYQKIRK